MIVHLLTATTAKLKAHVPYPYYARKDIAEWDASTWQVGRIYLDSRWTKGKLLIRRMFLGRPRELRSMQKEIARDLCFCNSIAAGWILKCFSSPRGDEKNFSGEELLMTDTLFRRAAAYTVFALKYFQRRKKGVTSSRSAAVNYFRWVKCITQECSPFQQRAKLRTYNCQWFLVFMVRIAEKTLTGVIKFHSVWSDVEDLFGDDYAQHENIESSQRKRFTRHEA